MKIIVNCSSLADSLAGIGYYLLSLLDQFNVLRTDLDWRCQYGMNGSTPLRSEVDRSRSSLLEGIKKAVALRVPTMYDRARSLRRGMIARMVGESDVYFEPNLIPLDFRAKRVVTTIHDFSCYHHPEWHPEERIENFRRHFASGLQRTDAIITPSIFVAQEARDYLDWNREIVTIYHGVREVFLDVPIEGDTHSQESDYSLYVGAIEPRKNLLRLLKAWKSLPGNIVDGQRLLIVGSTGWKNAQFLSEVNRMSGRVQFLGKVPDKELAQLYRNARCLIYPSLYVTVQLV